MLIYTKEFGIATKKDRSLPCAVTWMNLTYIMSKKMSMKDCNEWFPLNSLEEAKLMFSESLQNG
jgi:hypothetical protein